jgi:NitT/TauT family transport system permease protein
VFFIMFVSCSAGLRSVDGRLVSMARILGAPPLTMIRTIYWPSILPFVLTGTKLSLPRAIGATIVAEFLISDRGLGYMIENARQQADSTGVFAGIVAVTLLVLVIDIGLQKACAGALSWQPIDRDTALSA